MSHALAVATLAAILALVCTSSDLRECTVAHRSALDIPALAQILASATQQSNPRE